MKIIILKIKVNNKFYLLYIYNKCIKIRLIKKREKLIKKIIL